MFSRMTEVEAAEAAVAEVVAVVAAVTQLQEGTHKCLLGLS
jgi:type III secretory pathway component EscS